MSRPQRIAKSRRRNYAKKTRVITLWIATHHFNTSVADWYIDSRPADHNWKPNLVWERACVRRCDVDDYLRAMNRYLLGAWAPNQEIGSSWGSDLRDEASDVMKALTITANTGNSN